MGKRLTRVMDSRLEYEQLLYRVEELTATAEKVTSVLSATPKGNNGQKDDVYATLIDCKERCLKKLKRLEEEKEELEEEISNSSYGAEKTAMVYRYVGCMKIEEIAERMCFDKRTIDRFLQSGRKKYNSVYNGIHST